MNQGREFRDLGSDPGDSRAACGPTRKPTPRSRVLLSSTPRQFNTSVQRTHQFNTTLTLTHPSVQHTYQLDTALSWTHLSVQHTPHFDKAVSSTHSSVPHTPQFNTPLSLLNWEMCWTEGFWVLNWGMCWTEGFWGCTDGFWVLKRCGPCVEVICWTQSQFSF